MKQTNKTLYVISTLYLAWLLLVLVKFGYTPTNDGDEYIEIAQSCLKIGQSYPCLPLIKGHPFIWNIGSINITALSLLWFHSIYPLLVFLCILKALTALFIGKIAQKLFSGKVAIIACILFSFYPNNWGQSTTILSEIPMIFFAFTALYIAISKESTIWLFTSGIIFGLANLFRPVAMVFLGTLLIYYIFFIKRNWIKKCLSLCGGYVLFIVIVGSLCYQRTGYFLYQAETLWYNMAEVPYKPSVAPQYSTNLYPKETSRYIENMNQKTAIECNAIWKERSMAVAEGTSLAIPQEGTRKTLLYVLQRHR